MWSTAPTVPIAWQAALPWSAVPTRYDLDRDALAALLDGEPRYRVEQVWDGLHRQLREPAELTSVPKSLRARLDADAPAALTPVAESATGDGQTVKWLFGLDGGARVETVLMHYPDRTTVCVSTQAGCAMGCGFCATGQGGFQRQMTTGRGRRGSGGPPATPGRSWPAARPCP